MSVTPPSDEGPSKHNRYDGEESCGNPVGDQNDCLDDTLHQRENDLLVAAELGKALLADNEQLKAEKHYLLEEFCQKIHELENEKHSLKLRLAAVENDYELQMRELQTDIKEMRSNVRQQKIMYQEAEREKQVALHELTQQNESLVKQLQDSTTNERLLSQKLKQLKEQVSLKRSSMHDHLSLLETLRSEISQLREEKRDLETRLEEVTEERDSLLDSLADCQQHVRLLKRDHEEQQLTMTNQESEIAYLQHTAAALQHRLHTLSGVQTTSLKGETEEPQPSTSSRPHHSLFAEIVEQTSQTNGHISSQLWLPESHDAFPDYSGQSGDDSDVEMDDDALLAYVEALNQSQAQESGVLNRQDMESVVCTSGISESSELTQELFIGQLRNEVAEIYQQMKQMCAEVGALTSSVHESSNRRRNGTSTPDELALVEMDFRLASLRSVLSDLVGLLRELLKEPAADTLKEAQKHKLKLKEHGTNTAAPCNSHDPASKDHPDGDLPCDSDAQICQVHQEREDLSAKRDALKAALERAENDLAALRFQVEDNNVASKPTASPFVGNWQEFDDDEYEFELPS